MANCVQCGYQLDEPKCPECGATQAEQNTRIAFLQCLRPLLATEYAALIAVAVYGAWLPGDWTSRIYLLAWIALIPSTTLVLRNRQTRVAWLIAGPTVHLTWVLPLAFARISLAWPETRALMTGTFWLLLVVSAALVAALLTVRALTRLELLLGEDGLAKRHWLLLVVAFLPTTGFGFGLVASFWFPSLWP